MAALDAAGVPVDETSGEAAGKVTAEDAAVASAGATGDQPNKSGGVFGYLFGGGGARDEAAEAGPADGER